MCGVCVCGGGPLPGCTASCVGPRHDPSSVGLFYIFFPFQISPLLAFSTFCFLTSVPSPSSWLFRFVRSPATLSPNLSHRPFASFQLRPIGVFWFFNSFFILFTLLCWAWSDSFPFGVLRDDPHRFPPLPLSCNFYCGVCVLRTATPSLVICHLAPKCR